jgi:two-component system NtrC family response regulator
MEIPPLRSRAEDIPLLAEHFVRMLNPDMRLSPEAMRLVREYGWPGNIRELANVMRRATVMCSGDTILPDHLSSRLLATPADSPMTSSAPLRSAPNPDPEGFCEHYAREDVLEGMGAEELDRMLQSVRALESSLVATLRKKGGTTTHRALKETEAETIGKTLEQCRWNIAETSRALGIGRNTLYRKIRQYDLLKGCPKEREPQ